LLRHGECVLIDFGQAVRLRSTDGTPLRYFAEAGKCFYRAPEMYVPRQREVQVLCPGESAPGTVAPLASKLRANRSVSAAQADWSSTPPPMHLCDSSASCVLTGEQPAKSLSSFPESKPCTNPSRMASLIWASTGSTTGPAALASWLQRLRRHAAATMRLLLPQAPAPTRRLPL